jgi:hypothetical protein
VRVYQQQDSVIPNVPKFVGTTDTSGRFTLPTLTTREYAELFGQTAPLAAPNPLATVYSAGPNVVGTNSVLVIRIEAQDGTRAYRFLDAPQLNLEYARGHATSASYALDLATP